MIDDIVGVQTRDRVRRGSSHTINENDNLQFQKISVHIKIEAHDFWLRKGEGLIVLRSSRYAGTRARWHLRMCIAD